jgi:hypothetical protein
MGKLNLVLFNFLVVLLSLVISFRAGAQELNCSVTVNSDQLVAQQKTDAQTVEQMRSYISEFMNNQKWTNDRFSQEERIKCKLNINLVRSPSQGNFEATAQFVVTRPVYNSNYETALFTYVDRTFNFTFLPNTPMMFNENNYTEELPFTLAFYAMIALAFDYDSFSPNGGTPYIQRAFNIATLARNSSSFQRAWSTTGDTRNRYWLIENLMNQQLDPFRKAVYEYHRLGLDVAVENPVGCRKQVLSSLVTIKQVVQMKPSSVAINSFFDAKSEEYYKVLSEGTAEEKQQAFSLLSSMDPGKTEMYRRLIQ